MHKVLAVARVSLFGLLAAGSAVAADGSWSSHGIAGYVSVGMADVRAMPDTGGTITMSFNDSGTADLDKSIVGGSGRRTNDYLPSLALGVRLGLTDTLSLGLEGGYYSFSDGISTVPRDAPGTTPLPNFATYRETSLFKLSARDLAYVAGYHRDGIGAELLAGLRKGSFQTRSEIEAFGVFTSGNFLNLALSNGSAFDGSGPLFGLRLSYELPKVPLKLVARYRYSKLDGRSDSFGRAVGTVASSPSAPLVGAATVTRNDAISQITVHDQEYGLQYDISPGARGMGTFVRLAWMQTSWQLTGPPTGGAGFGGTIGTLTTNSFASAGLGEGKLRGTVLTAGVTF